MAPKKTKLRFQVALARAQYEWLRNRAFTRRTSMARNCGQLFSGRWTPRKTMAKAEFDSKLYEDTRMFPGPQVLVLPLPRLFPGPR